MRLKVREAWLKNVGLHEVFAAENPFGLPRDEVEIIRSWRHYVAGRFYIVRQLRNYAVFLSAAQPPVAYGVLALSQPLEELVGPDLPVMVEAVLLPFKDKIVYDSIMSGYSISFGPGIRRSLNESYKEAKQNHGIVTSLSRSSA